MVGGMYVMKSSGAPAYVLWDDSFRRTMSSLFMEFIVHGDIHGITTQTWPSVPIHLITSAYLPRHSAV